MVGVDCAVEGWGGVLCYQEVVEHGCFEGFEGGDGFGEAPVDGDGGDGGAGEFDVGGEVVEGGGEGGHEGVGEDFIFEEAEGFGLDGVGGWGYGAHCDDLRGWWDGGMVGWMEFVVVLWIGQD